MRKFKITGISRVQKRYAPTSNGGGNRSSSTSGEGVWWINSVASKRCSHKIHLGEGAFLYTHTPYIYNLGVWHNKKGP
jgi:hypothetical protein